MGVQSPSTLPTHANGIDDPGHEGSTNSGFAD